MEPKQKRPGSFGVPDEVMKAVNESKNKAKGEQTKQDYKDSESIPDDVLEDTKAETKENPAKDPGPVAEEKTNDEIAADFRKDLGISLSEDDMWSFLFKGSLAKKDVVIIPGKMVATFKTITMDQTQNIDENLASALEKKLLNDGFRNLQTRYVLAQGIASLNKPGSSEKKLGETPEEVFNALGALPTLLVEKISQKWNRFVWLVNYEVNKNMEVADGKNS